ncbi:MAG: hypothetical protein NTU80_01660 [Verrucomicrobia bacterium]|nr:hypothetical protein [Verrucomicrobiota bacterium]
MNEHPRQSPRLDPVPFILADFVLLASAALIGWQAAAPLGVAPLAAISLLVGLGAIVALYPFVVNHARRQEDAVQERANQIEALARTLGATAEQVSIAVSSLPSIADQAARQLKLAEQLPAAIQARISSLQHQVSATASEENAALRHELDTLRGAETEKVAFALTGLARASADLARLETLVAKHATALDGAIAHLPKLADAFSQQATETLRRETTAAIASLKAAAAESSAVLASQTTEENTLLRRELAAQRSTQASELHSALETTRAHLATFTATLSNRNSSPTVLSPPADSPAPAPLPAPEPAPQPAPVATIAAPPPPPPPAAPEIVLTPEPEAEPEPGTANPEPPPEPALTHDGFTRLVVTAYIGIGNKLYIRGDGPGLRRDKGVPLQFVSIGKWRWESAELLFPASVRLYKNDQIECTALGSLTLEPGHHHEVTASF